MRVTGNTKNNYSSMFLLVIISLLSLQSCKKGWLEAKVDKRQAVPTTVTDFQAMLDDVSGIPSVNLNYIAGHLEYASDGLFLNANVFNNLSGVRKNLYTRNEVEPYENWPAEPDSYRHTYNKVLNMNIVLSESERSTDPDKKGLDQVRAQALFHRARHFYHLAQMFIPPYNKNSASSDPGLALRLNVDITEPSVRSSVQQTYDQIISDLLSAKDVLPQNPAFITRASKPAAIGMLAKVYLAIGDYPKAFQYANEYLQIKNALLDYSALSKTSSFIGINTEVAFFEYFTAISSQLVEQSFYDSYSGDDIRKQVFFQVAQSGITFKGTYGNTRTFVFSGISTDEMYLIRAEGYARAGNITLAMKDLNDLLKTRWAKNTDGSTKFVDQMASNEFDALNKILLERRKQLLLRNVRWSDLRRLNQEDRFKITLTRTVNGQTHTLEPGSYKYTLPIPYEVIQKSSLKQNPGW